MTAHDFWHIECASCDKHRQYYDEQAADDWATDHHRETGHAEFLKGHVTGTTIDHGKLDIGITP